LVFIKVAARCVYMLFWKLLTFVQITFSVADFKPF